MTLWSWFDMVFYTLLLFKTEGASFFKYFQEKCLYLRKYKSTNIMTQCINKARTKAWSFILKFKKERCKHFPSTLEEKFLYLQNYKRTIVEIQCTDEAKTKPRVSFYNSKAGMPGKCTLVIMLFNKNCYQTNYKIPIITKKHIHTQTQHIRFYKNIIN